MSLKNVFLFLAIIGTGVMPAIVSAQEVNRMNLTIDRIHPISGERAGATNSQNLTRVYVNPGAWGSSDCRTDAADLKKEDTHTLSVLLTAFALNRSVDIYVDSTSKPWGRVCQITAVTIN